VLASGAPQSPQNFWPGGFSVLQFEQRIGFAGRDKRPGTGEKRRQD
jgi:hypothetical protein